MRKIYMDNAATTKVAPEVIKAMMPYFDTYYGNASEPHLFGEKAREAIENSREIIADFLGTTDSSDIIFTSCATESLNLVHKGLVKNYLETHHNEKPHIITTPIEHKAVLEACKNSGAEITFIPVDFYGRVNEEDIRMNIKTNTILVSVMYVNNEIGTIQPIKDIGEMLKEWNKKHKTNILFHTDATQAIEYLDCNVDELGVDLLSFSGHKIHAPKGVGCLFIRSNSELTIPLTRQQDGGGQEFGLRAGTENVPYIVGLAKAVELIEKIDVKKIKRLRDDFMWWIVENLSDELVLTGSRCYRAPHIASYVSKNIKGIDLVSALSRKGIACASGSACNSDSIEPSHVLKAIKTPKALINGSIRFSLSKYTTRREIQVVEKELKMIVNTLRGKKL
jgi:cysteine desulfurase